MTNLFVGDSGTILVIDCGADISSATVRSIKVKKPNGVTVTWTASADTVTTMRYVIQPGDLDVSGGWKFQSYVEMPVWKGRGAIVSLNVLPIL